MKLRTKILITVLLGVLAHLLIQRIRVLDRKPGWTYELTAGEMAQQYRVYNEKYFYGGLPSVIIIITDDIPEDAMAQTLCVGSKCTAIMIAPHYHPSPKQADMTLLHECCHVWDAKNKIDEGSDDHGPAFQGCMLRLAKEGAFDGLW